MPSTVFKVIKLQYRFLKESVILAAILHLFFSI